MMPHGAFYTYRIEPLGVTATLTVPDFRRFPMGYGKHYRVGDRYMSPQDVERQYRAMASIQEGINANGVPTTD